MSGGESIWSDTAAWVEAIGAIAAVIGSGWVAASDSRATRRREERAAVMPAAIAKPRIDFHDPIPPRNL